MRKAVPQVLHPQQKEKQLQAALPKQLVVVLQLHQAKQAAQLHAADLAVQPRKVAIVHTAKLAIQVLLMINLVARAVEIMIIKAAIMVLRIGAAATRVHNLA